MPTWIIALLKWGGIALAVIGVVALGSVEWFSPAPAVVGVVAQPTAAPVTLYIVLSAIGVIAAMLGFALVGPEE